MKKIILIIITAITFVACKKECKCGKVLKEITSVQIDDVSFKNIEVSNSCNGEIEVITYNANRYNYLIGDTYCSK